MVLHGSQEEPTREWWAYHMGTERPLSPVIDRTIWVPAIVGGALGPRTRDTRSTGLSAPLLPAADSRVDLSFGYLAPPCTWISGRRRNPGSQSPGATQAAPVVNKPENCQVHSSSSGALAIRGSSPGCTMPAGDIVKAFEAAHYAGGL